VFVATVYNTTSLQRCLLIYLRLPTCQVSVAHTCNLNYLGGWDLKDSCARPAWANISRDPIFKITRAKWTGCAAEAVEHLLCKHETLSSNPSPTHTHTHMRQPTWQAGMHVLKMNKSNNWTQGLLERIQVLVYLKNSFFFPFFFNLMRILSCKDWRWKYQNRASAVLRNLKQSERMLQSCPKDHLPKDCPSGPAVDMPHIPRPCTWPKAFSHIQ
jgi:hypothetical protein